MKKSVFRHIFRDKQFNGVFEFNIYRSIGNMFANPTVGAWYDPTDISTMFQDSTGTTPVTGPGQPVGLRLDKSKGLALGPDEVTNGNNEASLFSTASGPTATRGTIVRATDLGVAAAKFTCNASGPVYIVPFGAVPVPANKSIKITYRVYIPSAWTGAGIRPVDTSDGSYNPTVTSTRDQWVSVSYIRAAKATAWLFGIGDPSPTDHTGQSFYIDDLSIQELPGNHAVQSTAGARLTYGIEPKTGTRNLLTYSEDFSNPVWLKTTSPAITLTNQGNGVWRLQASAGDWLLYQNKAMAGTVTLSMEVKSNGSGLDGFSLMQQGNAMGDQTATSDWVRYSSTGTNGGSGSIGIIRNSSLAAIDVLIRFPQMETGSTVTPYQKVVTAFEVTQSGVPTCHYCAYAGANSMATASINFTATDKMSVFIGVQKLSTSVNIIAELGPNSDSTNGTFALGAYSTEYLLQARGTNLGYYIPAGYPSPITNVISGLLDIGGSTLATEIIPRINGVVNQTGGAGGNIGTGTFGNYPIYIGRRAGTTLPFSGRDYGILVVGKTASSADIRNVETFLANNTPNVTL